MPIFNQKGLAPLFIVGLIGLAIITTAGTYFALNLMNPAKQEPVIPTQPIQPAQNPPPAGGSAPLATETLSIQEVKAANEETLLNMEGVQKVDVGQKDGKPCVIVFTFKETSEIHELQENGLSGYEVVVQNSAQTN